MKKNRFFHNIIWFHLYVIFLIIQNHAVCAQEIYYYYGDEKVNLITDSTSLKVFFKEEFAHLNSHATFTDIIINKTVLPDYDFEDTTTAILYTSEIIYSIPDFLKSQGIQINMLKGFSYGYRTSQDGIIFPSLVVAFRLNEEKSINSLPIIDLLSKYDAEFISNEYGVYYYEVKNVQDAFDLSNELFESRYVLWSEPVFYSEIYNDNDPLYWWQYYLNNVGQDIDDATGTYDIDIDAPEAWDITKGGSSIRVAVIDNSGVEDHTDLRDEQGNPRVLSGHTSNCTFNCNGSPDIDTAYHGNAVTCIIAASHNNIGIKGIAPNIKIIPILLRPTTNMMKDAKAIGKAWNDLKSDVLCFAMRYVSSHKVIDDAFQIAREKGRNGKGAIVIATSGNTFGNVAFPGSVNGVITVGAIDLKGKELNELKNKNQ